MEMLNHNYLFYVFESLEIMAKKNAIQIMLKPENHFRVTRLDM